MFLVDLHMVSLNQPECKPIFQSLLPSFSDMSQSSGEICVNPYHYERLSHSNHGRMQYFRDDGSDNEQQPEKLILVLDDNEPDDINNDEK